MRANVQWSPPDLDYSKFMNYARSKVAGDEFYLLFEFEFCI